MKKFAALLFASILGGLITLGGIYLMQPSAHQFGSASTTDAPATAVKLKESPGKTMALPGFREAAEKSMPAVVHISSTFGSAQASNTEDDNPFRQFFGEEFFRGRQGPQKGSGSGVIYSSDGFIITNNHVVANSREVEVTLYDNRKFRATVVGTNPKTDLAVLKIDAADLPTLKAADSDVAEIGDWVLAVGNPFELRSTVTAGIISAKGRSIRLLGGGDAIESFIQTDAAVNPGNSGGALVDVQGNLLGINTAIATDRGVFSGYSFAIPINLVARIADDIIEFGSYQRPFLGVSIFDLDNEMADSLNVNITQGVVIERILEGGSAQYADVKPYDVILKVNNRDIRNVPELQEAIGLSKVGETINLTVLRNRREKQVNIRLRGQE